MIKITPKGYNNTNVINIPFNSVSSCETLKNKIKNDYNLSNGILVYKSGVCSLSNFFDSPFLVDNDQIINVEYINSHECLNLNVELFDRSFTVETYINDSLRRAVYSVPFISYSNKYKFYINEQEINLNNKISEIINFNTDKLNYDIKVILVE